MAPETTVVAAVVAPAANLAVSFRNGEPQFPKSDGPMPVATETELAEESSSFPEQYVLLQAVPAAEREAELKEKAVAAPVAKAEASDRQLVKAASSQLSREFPQKSRQTRSYPQAQGHCPIAGSRLLAIGRLSAGGTAAGTDGRPAR